MTKSTRHALPFTTCLRIKYLPRQQRRHEALKEMSQLIEVISFRSKQVIEKRYFSVGIVPTDHENYAVHQNQRVQHSGQPEVAIRSSKQYQTNQGGSDFEKPGKPISGIYSRPDQHPKKDHKPKRFNVAFLVSRQLDSIAVTFKAYTRSVNSRHAPVGSREPWSAAASFLELHHRCSNAAWESPGRAHSRRHSHPA